MFSKRFDYRPGERVLVTAWPLRGWHGTLVRRTRLPWNGRRAWIVDLEGSRAPGGQRQPIAERGLIPVQSVREPRTDDESGLNP